jgi:hypothetical protein
VDVREAYEQWPDKGPLCDGRRLTLLTEDDTLAPGDTLRVAHVYEITEPGGELWVMGPKPVYGEQLDGRAVTPEVPDDDDPLAPLNYDGRVLPSPGIDHNFEPTTYHFKRPGEHELTWQIGELRSNTLRVEVRG